MNNFKKKVNILNVSVEISHMACPAFINMFSSVKP